MVTLPEGFTVNPDAADGQTMCTEAEANFGSEGPAHCPDNAKIGTFSIGTKALNGRLEGAVYIGEPKPGDQYRLFEIASGLRHQREARRLDQTRPDDRTAHGVLRRPAPGPVRRLPAPPLRLRSRPDGDPDHVHHLHDQSRVLSLEHDSRRTGVEPDLRPRIRPPRGRLSGPGPAVQPGARSPEPPTPTRAASAPSP